MLHGPLFTTPEQIGPPCDEGAIEFEPLGRKLSRYGLELTARLRGIWLVVVPRPDTQTLGSLKRIIHAKIRQPFVFGRCQQPKSRVPRVRIAFAQIALSEIQIARYKEAMAGCVKPISQHP